MTKPNTDKKTTLMGKLHSLKTRMEQLDEEKQRAYAKKFMDITTIYIMLFACSVALYRIDAFEANTFVYLLFGFISILLMCISYRLNKRYRIYGAGMMLIDISFLPAAFLGILLY